MSSENSNSTILFCIFIRFSQHFSGLVISGVWTLSLITDDHHHYLISGHHCPLYPPPVLSDKECHSLPARAPSQAPAPLSSPRTLYCTVLYCTPSATVHITLLQSSAPRLPPGNLIRATIIFYFSWIANKIGTWSHSSTAMYKILHNNIILSMTK